MNPVLMSERDGAPFELKHELTTVGRSSKSDLVIRQKSVSSMHCVIARFDDHLAVVDLGSTNGVWINGKRRLRGTLRHNDVLRVAAVAFKVLIDEPDTTPGQSIPTAGKSNTRGEPRSSTRNVTARDHFADFENRPLVIEDWQPGRTVFPGCVLGETLGEGGFGKVWRATLSGFGDFALKWIQISDPIRNEERALKLMKGLRHKHLVRVFGARRQEDVLVVAMELGEETLAQRFIRCRFNDLPGLPSDELMTYTRQVAEALDYLYFTRKLLHRDIKPSNLLLVDGVAKVCDMGLAKVIENEVGFHSGIASFEFAPPEFFEEKMVSSSDQFSLAVTFAYMLTGQKPFPGADPRQVMIAHLTGSPKLDAVPESLRPVVARALKRNPQERFESCSHFALALRRAGGSTA